MPCPVLSNGAPLRGLGLGRRAFTAAPDEEFNKRDLDALVAKARAKHDAHWKAAEATVKDLGPVEAAVDRLYIRPPRVQHERLGIFLRYKIGGTLVHLAWGTHKSLVHEHDVILTDGFLRLPCSSS